MNYELQLIEQHIILRNEGGDWLIDTGSPGSFGDSYLNLNHREIELKSSFMGLNAHSLSESINHKINGLIWVDILNKFYVVFDLPGASIQFHDEYFALDCIPLALSFFMDIPIVQSSVNGRNGALPDLLACTLLMAGTNGIIGNELLRDHKVAYSFAKKVLTID